MSTAPKQNITIQENAPAPMIQSETAAVLSMIERVARDPNADIGKVRELMAMRKESIAYEAEQNFNAAMAKAQSEMRAVSADSDNPQTRSRYASYFALDRAVRPVYTRHGFGLSFDTGEAPEGYVRVICYVTCAGHTRKYHIDMPADGKGAKGGDVMTKTHAAGAAASYGQRYLLKMIFNMAVGDDDDGNGASGRNGAKITDQQVSELLVLIADVAGAKAEHLKGRVLRYMKVENLADLPASEYANCTTAIEGQRKNYNG